MKDFVGNDITEGCWVIRAYNLGRCAALKYAFVTAVREDSFTTIGAEWSSYSKSYKVDWSKGSSKFPERSLVVDPDTVPESVKELVKDKLG